jgi:Transposase DDE domain
MSGHDDGNYSPRPEKGKGATESGPAAGYGTARQGQNIENDLRDDNSLRTAGPEQPPGDNNSKPEPGEQDQTDIRRASEQSRRDTRAPGSSEAGSSRRLQGIRVDTSSVRSSTDRNVRPAELSDANLALLPQADYKFRVPPSDDDPAPWEGQELPETFDVARMERQIEALSAEPTPEEMERLRLTKSRFDELPEQEKTKLQDHRLSEMMNPARDNQSLGQARDISKAELWLRSLLATREPVSYLKTRLLALLSNFGPAVLGQNSIAEPQLKHLFADGAYDRTKLLDKALFRDFVLEIVRRTDNDPGFKVLPRRWVVERTFGWMTHRRRLLRDYETRLDVSKAMIHLAMGSLLLRRIAHG